MVYTTFMTREAAWQTLNQWMSNPNLIKHCVAVETAMLAYADHFNVSEAERAWWGIAGLLHDADYEKFPTEHPKKIIAWLQEQQVPDDVINAIDAHGFDFGIEAKSQLAKTLRAVDELTGLIVATALVRESKKLADVSVESVQKKWNNVGFAKGVKREDIERGAEEIGVPLEKHIEIVLEAMQSNATALGL